MGDGEDDVVVVAGKESGGLLLEPSLDLDVGAQGAGAMFAGVVVVALEMAFGTCLDVSSQSWGAAIHDAPGGAIEVVG